MELIELLKKIADTAIELEKARKDYAQSKAEFIKSNPIYSERMTGEARRDWREKAQVITERTKELGRQFRGYLFIYERREERTL